MGDEYLGDYLCCLMLVGGTGRLGCRPIISLDGCHLKSITNGLLLTAVGIDPNDQIVPIAWAVVNKENKCNWRWLMCWLRQELQLQDRKDISIVSGMQKVKYFIFIILRINTYEDWH